MISIIRDKKMRIVGNIVLILLVFFLVWKLSIVPLITNFINNQSIQYVDYLSNNLNFTFHYPKNWKVEESSTKDEYLLDTKVNLEDPNGFSIIVISMEILKFPICTPQNMCGSPLIEPRIYHAFNPSDYEYTGNIENKKFYMSKTGGVDRTWKEASYPDGKYILETPVSIASYPVLEEKGNTLTENLTIFGHDGDKKAVFIYYSFDNEIAIKNWPEYKEILKHIIISMKYK